MNKNIIKISIFGAGVLSGFFIGYFSTKDKFKKIYAKKADDEIESVKDKFRNRIDDISDRIDEILDPTNEESVFDPTENTSSDSDFVFDAMVKEYSSSDDDKDLIEFISPDEFGEYIDYDIITLYYYADGVLADDAERKIDDVHVVGEDFAKHFGEYDDDSVFVRNDITRCYYEILRSNKDYLETDNDI